MARKKRLVSIQTRVSIFSILLIVLSLLTAAMSVTTFQIDDLKGLIGTEQLAAAQMLAGQIGQGLDDRLAALREVAATIDLPLLAARAQLQAILAAHAPLAALFNGGFFVTDSNGIAVASFPVSAKRVGVDFSDRFYFKLALQQGKSSVGPIAKGRTIGVPAVPMCVPILGIHGDPIGILVGVTDLTRPNFLDKFPLVAMGKATSVNLVDRSQRRIINSTEKSRIMEQLPDNPAFDQAMAEGGGFRVAVNSRNLNVLFSVARIPSADWFVSIYTPVTVAFGPAYRLQERLLWTLPLSPS